MYKFMRKYNRKLMALATVFLTVAFFMPQFKGSGRTPGEVTVGRFAGQKVNYAEVQNARAEWKLLKDNIVLPDTRALPGRGQERPLALVLGETAYRQIEEHEPMYLLLLKEAQAMGVAVSPRDVESLMGAINVRLPDGRLVLADKDNLGEMMAENVEQTVRDFLLVCGARDRAATSVVKISQPLIDSRMATQGQEIKLQLIEFDAKDYLAKVPTPAPEALQKQFDKYADVLPVEFNSSDDDPSGFGYKLPDRIKLQYISVAQDQVRAAVKASKSDYEWEVAAQGYYKKHGDLFAATQPATKAADAFSLDPNRKSPPSTNPSVAGPTTRPFEEVREQILNRLIEPQVNSLMKQVAAKISNTMVGDNGVYRAALRGSGGAATTAPSTMPATAFHVPYDSFDYLQKLAEEVQKELKVLPTVASLGESFLTEKQLQKLPGIGESSASVRQGELPFAEYALALAAPFHPNLQDSLHLFEPSPPLYNRDGNTIYFFRLTAADPAHKPASLADVHDAVERDVKLTEAMKLAHDAADAAMQAAKASTLRKAAIAAGKTALETGFFSSNPREAIPGVSIGENSRKMFADSAFKLLVDAAKNPQTPATTIIDLPRDGKVLVAQLADVSSQFVGPQLSMVQAQAANALADELRHDLFNSWFSYDHLKQRLNFQDESRGSKKPAPEG